MALAGAASAQPFRNVAAGDTSQNAATLLANTDIAGNVFFEVATDAGFTNIVTTANAAAQTLVPAKTGVSGLTAGTRYFYRATDSAGNSRTGQFKTAKPSNAFGGFRMGVSGDWRGELAPYPAVRNAAGRDLDTWVSLGDTVYADVPSPAVPVPQATTLNEFRLKHREVYSERFGLNTLGDIRESTSVIVSIDDHEVTNDFQGGASPSSDPRFAGQSGNFINETQLYRDGLQAFHEFNPIESRVYSGTGDARLDNKPKLYRENQFGKNAVVLTTDARSFRDQGLPAANLADPASVANYLGTSLLADRTMLGRQQTADLKADLLEAQNNGTVWKFVNIAEPIQNLGVLGASDRFEGYARERNDILRFIDENNIQNVVFVAADIHGTLVNNLNYQNVPGGPQISSGAFEITTGSVAYDAPFGPTIIEIAAAQGLITPQQAAFYQTLPLPQREGFIQNLINSSITPLGYDALGLQGSDIPATLLQGSYTATSTFGWTEFDVNPDTLALTVTTWGVLPYTEAELLADPAGIAAREPFIVSQFVVAAVPAPSALVLMGLAGAAGARRRRR
jgi:phosphodiesterase/alkaline phosphatase D-like protein